MSTNVLKIVDSDYYAADIIKSLFGAQNLQDVGPISFSFLQNLTPDVEVESVYLTHSGLNVIKNQKIALRFDPSVISGPILDQIISQIRSDTLLTHKTNITVPTPDDDPSVLNYNSYVSDAFSYYNLKNIQYENFTLNRSERSLPNFSLGALWARGNSDYLPEHREYYTMFNAAPDLDKAQISAGVTNINNFEFDDEALGSGDAQLGTFSYKTEEIIDYYKHLIKSSSIDVSDYDNANNHVFVDYDYKPSDSENIGNTPFFNRIKLPFVKGPRATSDLMTNSFVEANMTDKLIKSFRNAASSDRSFRVNGTDIPLKTYSIESVYQNLSVNDILRQDDEMFLRSKVKNYSTDSNSVFVKYFNRLILLGKLRAAGRAYLKDFERIIQDDESHDGHLIGYKVIKTRGTSQVPLQTFYFLHDDVGLQDFVDTQIRFDTVYNYQIIAMFGVHGSSYSYQNIEKINNSDFYGIKFDFVISPSMQIVEIPVASYSLRIVEPPPINPEVHFYNESNSKNKVKIRLEHQDGNIVDEYSKKPMMPFRDNDVYIQKLEQYFRKEEILVTSGKTSDGVYEIYRIDYPPKSYLDFEDALIATVQSDIVYSNGERSRNVMFTDMIKHQQKYYYCFRTLTHRGNPSEMSHVYVVEMYEDADETFLTFDIYNAPDPEYFQKSIHMRKYIQILPNHEQITPNTSELLGNPSIYPTAQSALNSLTLGDPNEEDLWEYSNDEKYIKLRLESKNSGRKMDINLRFVIKRIN